MGELIAYATVLLLAYVVWRWWGRRRVDRVPRLPELKVRNELTPIDPLVIKGGRSTTWLSPPKH